MIAPQPRGHFLTRDARGRSSGRDAGMTASYSLDPPRLRLRSMSTEPLRLDEAGAVFAYVNSTSAWVHRCARRMLELDPDLDPMAARHTVDGMATSPRWRLMLPEAVAEALYADEPQNGAVPLTTRNRSSF